ncbi:hypothetical protein [Stenotrophomonas tumulicola]|uniref:Uncharacterized protein n=1 Tax=Stenotrophomonas tumulicola TaxID=1685415 RepID=A0A7W3FJ29_9GAMM|nr:hypothetical protein [Stenotrophomonas tumulicola]MBA8680492.1 hypothetical protein [Stenotrophomonas tumulicola]
MATTEEIEAAQRKLDRARSERDSWKGKNRHNYEMAALLVAALEKQLAKLVADSGH